MEMKLYKDGSLENKNNMEWISVKDRLPGSISNHVLVYRKGKKPEMAYFLHTEKFYSFTIGYDVGQTWSPEYWARLPKLEDITEIDSIYYQLIWLLQNLPGEDKELI